MGILVFERAAVAWSRRLALVGGWMLLGVSFVTVGDALLRYLFARPIPGTFEATELFLAIIIFFALPYASLTDGHVSVDMLTGRLGRRAQNAVIAGSALVTAVLLALVTIQLWHLCGEVLATSRTTITARIPVYPFLLPVTLTGGLAAVAFVVQAVGAAARVVRPDLPPLAGPGDAR